MKSDFPRLARVVQTAFLVSAVVAGAVCVAALRARSRPAPGLLPDVPEGQGISIVRGREPAYLLYLREIHRTWSDWSPYAHLGHAFVWLLVPLCLVTAALFVLWIYRGGTVTSQGDSPVVTLWWVSLAGAGIAAVFALVQWHTVNGPLVQVTEQEADRYLLLIVELSGLLAVCGILGALVVRRVTGKRVARAS